MYNREWYQVDNVANVFLATVNSRDTRSLRISCTLKENIDKAILQEALDETIILRPQFHVRIHRGIFWHYMEESNTKPEVKEEYRRICPMLYNPENRQKLHFDVSFYKNRINLDLFHAISDGTGAIEFINLLVLNYLKRIHHEELKDTVVHSGASAEMLSEDSYKHFYENTNEAPELTKPAYHPRGLKLPYNQLQFIEAHMPLQDILKRSRELGVGLTSYISAALIIAFMHDMPVQSYTTPISLSIPVNLRNYYPSESLRNFFNNVELTHYPSDKDSFQSIATELDRMLKETLTPEKIKLHMNHFLSLQKNAAIRAVPLFLKQPGLKFLTKQSDKHVSAVVSNLGIMKIPEQLSQYIDYYSAFCSSENTFVTTTSYKDKLVLGITNPYVNTGVVKEFIRSFTKNNIPVRIYSTEVLRQ